MSQDAKITFETIYEILRNEKKNEELNKLDFSFLADATQYLKERQASALPDDELTQKQISNVKRMLTEIIERREAKIVKLAMHSARLSVNFVDKSKLTDVELALFYELNKRLRDYRASVLDAMLKGAYVSTVPQAPLQQEAKEEIAPSPALAAEMTSTTNDVEIEVQDTVSQAQDLKTPVRSSPVNDSFKAVTFTANVSKFVGENMEIFGPYTKDEQAKLPRKIADILIARQQAL